MTKSNNNNNVDDDDDILVEIFKSYYMRMEIADKGISYWLTYVVLRTIDDDKKLLFCKYFPYNAASSFIWISWMNENICKMLEICLWRKKCKIEQFVITYKFFLVLEYAVPPQKLLLFSF